MYDLSKHSKILFLTHLALGDFTYLQPFFQALAQQYPHLKIDLWIERIQWAGFLSGRAKRNHILHDWLDRTSYLNKIYSGESAWQLMHQARKENYEIIVPLCTIKQRLYRRYAKKISPKGMIATSLRPKDYKHMHISQFYKIWFEKLFSLKNVDATPFINIPREWVSYGKLKCMQWGVGKVGERFERVVFINSFANNVMRCWPIDRVVKLIMMLRQKAEFEDAFFIINVEPYMYKTVQSLLSNYCLQRVFLFTAHRNFFQIPSIISLCDLVISVETSTVHLACALDVSVVALMRGKNPEWGPFHSKKSRTIIAPGRSGWVEDISLERVVKEVEIFVEKG